MLSLLVVAAFAGPKPPPPTTPACMPQYTAMAEAGPAAAGKAYAEFVACDPIGGKTHAPTVFARIIAGPGGDLAATTAIGLGLGDVVRTWAGGMQPDERSQTIDALGKSCDKPGVPEFFVESQKALGEKFWGDRWYAGLDDCRAPVAQKMLTDAVHAPNADRARYKSILETFSRNLGKDAVPVLTERLKQEKEAEVAAFLVAAYADAAGVGTPAGIDAAAAQAATEAIVALAPALPAKAVEQARFTLMDLRAEEPSDHLVVVRFKDLLQADGTLLYGAYISKVATCKKGDTRVEVHTAAVNGGTHAWPDQVATRVKPTADTLSWKLPKDCVGEVKIVTSPVPLKDAAALKSWLGEMDKETMKAAPGVKWKMVGEEAMRI